MAAHMCNDETVCVCLDFFFFIHSAVNVFTLVLTVVFTQQGYGRKNERGKSVSSREVTVYHCVYVHDCVLL